MFRHSLIALSAAMLVAQTPAPEAKKPLPAARPEAPKAEDKALATIGGEVVRESDLELFLSMVLNPQQRMQVGMVQGAKDQYRKQFLDTKVMAAAARQQGMDKHPEFKRKLDLMMMQLLVQEIFQRDGDSLKAKIVVDDAGTKAYYDAHPDQFKSPESFNVRHILVTVKEPNAPADAKGYTEEEAKARVAQAAKALEEGKGWEAVAKDFSDDPSSKDKGGLYENIAFGSFVPEFEAAVRAQELGKVGAPVKTKYGFHLIQKEKLIASEVQPFEKVKDQAKQKALAAKQEEVFQGYLDGLKKSVGYADGEAKVPVQTKTTKKKSGAKK
jgi:parvulin-like peptidyl-prolyl isomerase